MKPNKQSFFQAQPFTKMQNFCPPVPLTVSELHPSSNNTLKLREWGEGEGHTTNLHERWLIATQKDLSFVTFSTFLVHILSIYYELLRIKKPVSLKVSALRLNFNFDPFFH